MSIAIYFVINFMLETDSNNGIIYLQFQNDAETENQQIGGATGAGVQLLSGTSPAAWKTSASAAATHRFADCRRTFWTQRFNTFGTASSCTLGERARIQITIKIGIRQLWTYRQPSGTDARITTKQMQSPTSQTEMLDNVKYFNRFIVIAKRFLFRNNEININVGMNEIAVRGTSHGAFDAHQTMFFSSLEHCFRLEYFRMTRIVDVGADPANILASAEAPFTQAIPAHVQSLRTAAPQKNETSMCGDFIDF